MAEQVVTFSAEAAGERLDKLIADKLTQLSRTQIQRLIDDGFVRVDGQAVTKPATRLNGPMVLEVRVPPPAPTGHRAENIDLDIVFENDDLIVINKPAGMVVHPAAGHWDGTLVNAVLGHAPDLVGVGEEQRPGIVHRLDKDTSGLILVAKNDAAHRSLQSQFKNRTVDKRYIALLDGHPATPTGRIEAGIGRDPRNRKRMSVLPGARGRESVTEFRELTRYAEHSLVEAHPLTGRTHQLRLHFAYIGCPIAGDTVYGRRKPTLRLKRQFLHAAKLTLALPGSERKMTFEAPLPPDLEAALKLLTNDSLLP
ncbi:MAG: RluA family pseudouridine synthase [Anaerolineales bacterium]